MLRANCSRAAVGLQRFLNRLTRTVVSQRAAKRRPDRRLARIAVGSGCERLEERCLLAAGFPDTSWNVIGRTTTDFGVGNDRGAAVVLQTDGKVVVGGMAFGGVNDDFALSRYNRDGSLDTSFGTRGLVATNFGIGDDRILRLALQPDGKIIAGGKAFNGSNFDFALARYNIDGSLDTTFGIGGLVVNNLGNGDDLIAGVAVLPDGRIVAAGATFGTLDSDFAVARYLSNGLLDTSFGGDGVVTTDSGRGADAANGLVVQPDGRIVVVGSTINGSAEDFGIMRYLTDGSHDPSFGTNGGVATAFGNGSDRAFKVALTSGGKIVVVGTTDNGLNLDFAVARYLPNGTLDNTFDSDGKLTLDFNSGDDIAFGVAVQPNGQIVVAGVASNGTRSNFAVARLQLNGGQDPTFSVGGTVLTQFAASRDATGRAISIQANGTIVVAGFTFNGTNDDFAVARYQGDPIQRMYRLYNPNANFHFFTSSQAEFQFAVARGYRDETTARTGFSVATTQQPGSLPLHRLYNPNKGSHYYTTNDGERDTLVSLGWRFESDEGFIFTSQVSGTVEVYRLWNRDSGVHLFTESSAARDAILAAFPGSWQQHASVGFAFPVTGLGEAQAAARSAALRSAASRGEVFATAAGNFSITEFAHAGKFDPTAEIGSQLATAINQPMVAVPLSDTSHDDVRPRTTIPPTASTESEPASFDQAWEDLGIRDLTNF